MTDAIARATTTLRRLRRNEAQLRRLREREARPEEEGRLQRFAAVMSKPASEDGTVEALCLLTGIMLGCTGLLAWTLFGTPPGGPGRGQVVLGADVIALLAFITVIAIRPRHKARH